MLKFILAFLIIPLTAFGQAQTVVPSTSKNFVKNPSCILNARNITASAGSVTRSTANKVSTSSCDLDAAASGVTYKWALNNFDLGLTGQSCEAKFTYTGDASLYKAYVERSSAVISNSIQLEDATAGGATGGKTLSLNFPCGTNAAATTVTVESTSASAAAIKVADVYVGAPTNLGSVSSVTDWVDYGVGTITAVTSGPTKGTVVVDKVLARRVGGSLQVQYTIHQSSAGGAGSGDYLFVLPAAAGCTIDTAKTGVDASASYGTGAANGSKTAVGFYQGRTGNQSHYGKVFVYDTTKVRLWGSSQGSTSNAWGAVGSANLSLANGLIGYDMTYEVPCAGWSTGQTAAAAEQTNFGWRSVTCATSWTTTVTPTCQEKRDGENLYVRGKILALGAVTNTALTVTIPGGRTIDTTKYPSTPTASISRINNSSAMFWNNSRSEKQEGGVYYSSTTAVELKGWRTVNGNLIVHSIASSSTAPHLDGVGGAEAWAINDYVEFEFSVPIVAWAENNKAPTLIGSVTSNAAGAERIERARIANNGTATIVSQSGAWIGSVSRTGLGIVSVVFSPVWNTIPTCTCTAEVGERGCSIDGGGLPSVSGAYFRTFTAAGAEDRAFSLTCIGAR